MERLDQATIGLIEQEVTTHFPAGTLRSVEVVQYGDDPAIEPGGVGIRMTTESPVGPEPDGGFLDAFKSTHREAFARLRRDINRRFPATRQIEIISGADPGNRFRTHLRPDEPPGDLTPVMARLGPADLETLDTLITAGIAANRAQAVRWALARIRERPAYSRLRERAREIDELKAQF